MTLTTAAQRVLEGAQSGLLDNIDTPLRELNSLVTMSLETEELSAALGILSEARKAAYAHRNHIAINLQQLERSARYTNSSSGTQASWQLLG